MKKQSNSEISHANHSVIDKINDSFTTDNEQDKAENNSNSKEELIVNKVLEKVQIQTNVIENELVNKMIEKVQTQTKDNAEEIMEKIMDHTQDRCRCKLSPEGLVSFVIKTIIQFNDEEFLKQNLQNQILIIAQIFVNCTGSIINNTRLNQFFNS